MSESFRIKPPFKSQPVQVDAVCPNWCEAVRIGDKWRVSIRYAGSDHVESVMSDRLPPNPEGRGLTIQSQSPDRIVWVRSP